MEALLKTNIGFCARCGKDHVGLHFYKFKNPAGADTHWTPCPETGEPILLRIADSTESPEYTTAEVPFEFEGRNFVAKIEIVPVRRSNHISNGKIFIFKIMDAGVFENGQRICKGNGWMNFPVAFDAPL